MREKLIQYVRLLFAGAADCEDIQQEIMQNTLDRYDDLIAQGRTPESAYRLAILGIGDIEEIFQTRNETPPKPRQEPEIPGNPQESQEKQKALDQSVENLIWVAALAVFFLAGFFLNAWPVAWLVFPLAWAIQSREWLWVGGLAVYFWLNYTTGAWFITWLIFPLTGAVQGLVHAIRDLKEAK